MNEAIKALTDLIGCKTSKAYYIGWWVIGGYKLPKDVIIYTKVLNTNFQKDADLIAFVYTSTGKIIELHYDNNEFDVDEFNL